MSVSFVATIPGREAVVVQLGSYRAVSQGWAPLAQSIGLVYVPRFHESLTISLENIGKIVDEIRLVRAEFIRHWGSDSNDAAAASNLITALEGLSSTGEWDASIG